MALIIYGIPVHLPSVIFSIFVMLSVSMFGTGFRLPA